MTTDNTTTEPQAAQATPHMPAALPIGTPLDRIADLMLRGITPKHLDKYLDVQQRWEAEQARKAYVRAMAAFKAAPIETIRKNKTVRIRLKPKEGQPDGREMTYKQETLAQVVHAAIPALAAQGLSHSWSVAQDRQTRVIEVACVMTHEAGHSERVSLYGMPDESGQKNPLQQVRSTITYLQRASLLLITGLAAEDGSDDDAQSSRPQATTAGGGSGPATEKQKLLIMRKLATGPEEARPARAAALLAHLGIESIDALPFDRVNDALQWLQTP